MEVLKISLIILIVINLAKSKEEKPKIQVQENVKSLFLKQNELFSKTVNSHIIIPINLEIFDEKMSDLDNLLQRINQTFSENNLIHPTSHRKTWRGSFDLKRMVSTILYEIKNTKYKVKDVSRAFTGNDHLISKDPRNKRQLIAAAVGVVAGLIYSSVTESEVISAIKEENKVISLSVGENILKISEVSKDVKILNKTTALLDNQVRKLIIKQDEVNLKMHVLAISTMVRTYLNGINMLMDGLARSLQGIIDQNLINLIDLHPMLEKLKTRASQKGYVLSISSTLELPHVQTLVNLNQTHLNLVLSIPLENPSNSFMLYKYIPTPYPIKIKDKNYFITIKSEKTLLAVSANTNTFMEMDYEDLGSCSIIYGKYFCHSGITINPSSATCLLSLYKNIFMDIQNNCDFAISKKLLYGQLIKDRVLLVDTESKWLKLTYNNGTTKNNQFNGSTIVQMTDGSSVATANLFAAFPKHTNLFDVTDTEFLEETNKNNMLIFDKITNIDTNTLDIIDNKLKTVGSSLSLSELNRYNKFKRNIQVLEAKNEINSNIVYIIISLIATIFVIIAVIKMNALFGGCFKCCTKGPTLEGNEKAQPKTPGNSSIAQTFEMSPTPGPSVPPGTPEWPPKKWDSCGLMSDEEAAYEAAKLKKAKDRFSKWYSKMQALEQEEIAKEAAAAAASATIEASKPL